MKRKLLAILKSKKGETLTETLIALVILVMIITTVVMLATTALSLVRYTTAESQAFLAQTRRVDEGTVGPADISLQLKPDVTVAFDITDGAGAVRKSVSEAIGTPADTTIDVLTKGLVFFE